MKGGEALVETLIAHGVNTAFTVPGESFLYALEGMRKRRDQIRVVSVRQEGGGAFMAEAFGKLTGRPAAVFVSRGPGSSNAAIGIHTAMQDSTPMVVFVGHVNAKSMGRESFQEINQHAFFSAVAKAVLSPKDTNDIPRVTAEAVRLIWALGATSLVGLLANLINENYTCRKSGAYGLAACGVTLITAIVLLVLGHPNPSPSPSPSPKP